MTSFREAESACDEYLSEISRLKGLLAQATARADDAKVKEEAIAKEAAEMARQWGRDSCDVPSSSHTRGGVDRGGYRGLERGSGAPDSPMDTGQAESSSSMRRRPLLGQWIDAQHSDSAPYFSEENRDTGNRSSSSSSSRNRNSHDTSRHSSSQKGGSRKPQKLRSRPVEVKLGLSLPPSRGGSPNRKPSNHEKKSQKKIGGQKRSLPMSQSPSLAVRPPTPQTAYPAGFVSPSVRPSFASGPLNDGSGHGGGEPEHPIVDAFPPSRKFPTDTVNGEQNFDDETDARDERELLGRDISESNDADGGASSDGGGGALLDWNSRDPWTMALRAVIGQQQQSSSSSQGRNIRNGQHRGHERRPRQTASSNSAPSSSSNRAKTKGSVARLKAILKQQLRAVAEERRQEARWFEIQQEEDTNRRVHNFREGVSNQGSSPSPQSLLSPTDAHSRNSFPGGTFNRLQRDGDKHRYNDHDSVNSDDNGDDGGIDYEGSPVLGAPPKGSYWDGLDEEDEDEEACSSPAATVRMLRERRTHPNTMDRGSKAASNEDASEQAAEAAALASASIHASSLKDTFDLDAHKKQSSAATSASISNTLGALRPASPDSSPPRGSNGGAHLNAGATAASRAPIPSATSGAPKIDDAATKEKRKAERRAVIAAGKASRVKATAPNGSVQFEAVQHEQLFYKEESVASMNASLGHTVNAQPGSPVTQPASPQVEVSTERGTRSATVNHTTPLPGRLNTDDGSEDDDDESVEFFEEEDDNSNEEVDHVEEAMMEEYGGEEEFEEEFLDEDDEEEELTALAVGELGQKIRTGDTPSPSPFVGAPNSARSERDSVGLGGGGLESLEEGAENEHDNGGHSSSNIGGSSAAAAVVLNASQEEEFDQEDGSLESIADSDDNDDNNDDDSPGLPSALSEWLLERCKALGLLRTLQNRLEPWLLAQHRRASSGAGGGAARAISLADIGKLSAQDLDAVLGCASPEDRGPAHVKLTELVSEAKSLVMGG